MLASRIAVALRNPTTSKAATHAAAVRGFASTSRLAMSQASDSGSGHKHPRVGVSVAVFRDPSRDDLQNHASAQETWEVLLIQRGMEPNKGLWSFPGGKVELGMWTKDTKV